MPLQEARPLAPHSPAHENVMATATPTARPPVQTRVYYPLAGVLSYLVPGLGQIIQGRVAKGLLFLVCIYALFFYGIYLGSGTVTVGGRTYQTSSAVYLPDQSDPNTPRSALQRLGSNLYNRPQFIGQFWVGVAAWPAIIQYLRYDRDKYQEVEERYSAALGQWQRAQERQQEADRKNHEADDLLARAEKDPGKAAELRQQAEEARKAAQDSEAEAQIALEKSTEEADGAAKEERKLTHPLLGGFEREPTTANENMIHNLSDKRQELAWVFTVIAGVLNILVIYDAVAGPAVSAGLAPSLDRTRT
jgi:hypothetical protein